MVTLIALAVGCKDNIGNCNKINIVGGKVIIK